jgi:hypothetical protein
MGGQQPVTTPTAPQTPPGGPGPSQELLAKLAQQITLVKAGGNWFYWIAGLSLINAISSLLGSGGKFVIGLVFTSELNEYAAKAGGEAVAIGFVISLIIAGIYVMFGYFACRRTRWIFVVGMICYSIDTLMAFGVWLALGFHVLALFFIFNGFRAEGVARRIEEELRKAAYMQSQAQQPSTPSTL